MPVTLDQVLLQLFKQHVYDKHIAPGLGEHGETLWNNGVGRLTHGLIRSAGVQPVTGDEVAAGVLQMIGATGRVRSLRGPVTQPVIDAQFTRGVER